MMVPHPLRRIFTPLLMAAMSVFLVLAVAGSILGLIAALVDRRARILRLSLLVGVYASLDVVVPLVMLGTWLLRMVRFADDTSDLRAVGWALGTLLGAARVLCGFHVHMEEPSGLFPFESDDPVLVLARHGGVGDSFALVHLLIAVYGRRPRVVLKGILAWDPMLDVALTRMGACWIGRSSVGSSRHAVGKLAADVRTGDAILLFPEGRNWTPRRRMSAMARLWKTGRLDALKAAGLMEHVLPPMPGGVLACLDGRPAMPVVIMAHAGLDKITSFNGLWRALPFAVPMRLRWWPAAPAPSSEDARLQWLTAEWAVVDQWIDAFGP